MKITVVTGSRADFGLLEWPIKLLKEDPFFEVTVEDIWGGNLTTSFNHIENVFNQSYRPSIKLPDVMMVLGDREEILGAVSCAHLRRVPIAHIGGGDVTEGSYDDAMRDAISRMASIHFVTSTSAMARLTHMGYRNIHLVGSPGIDYIKHVDWKKERPYEKPYCVVSYQPETIDGTNEIQKVFKEIDAFPVFIMPNRDRGEMEIRSAIQGYCNEREGEWHNSFKHDEFLNLIYHCESFIGNSSSMLYEAPELGVKVKMIGKRQRGRVIPWGDGYASERIIKVLKYSHL